MSVKLKIKKTSEKAVIPQRATDGSAGLDLCACIEEKLTIAPGDLVKIPTGIAIELESEKLAAFIYGRSGLGIKHGICLSNSVGVVDSDYRGEICVGLCNVGSKPYTIEPGERIAQLVVMPVEIPEIEITQTLGSTGRGSGGFGSTGR